jgi:hypothetical protein
MVNMKTNFTTFNDLTIDKTVNVQTSNACVLLYTHSMLAVHVIKLSLGTFVYYMYV